MSTVLTYAGRAWSVLFLLLVLFLIVVFAGGAVYDWRDRRRNLAYLNDETFGSLTPQERHARYIEWIDEQLGVPS